MTAEAHELRRVVVAYETEADATARLIGFGYEPAIAREITVYLAQATDLPGFMPELEAAFAEAGIAIEFVTLDGLPALLPRLVEAAAETLLWSQTDGIRFYRGAALPSLARLLGLARYGSPPAAQHLCQDKFASLALAGGAGIGAPPTLLLQAGETIGTLGDWTGLAGPFFVKPNMLGAKIGIWADSRVADLDEARRRAERLWHRYGDRAVVQPFITGSDIRVSFLDAGGDLRSQLGIARLATDGAGETGGAFMTMRDNETLSGARDSEGSRGGFGATRPAAFIPHMVALRSDECGAAAVETIGAQAERLVRLLGLCDYFSMDFRLDAQGCTHFLEFEVCPAVTIYDFQDYLRTTHGLGLGPALIRSMRLAHRRRAVTAAA